MKKKFEVLVIALVVIIGASGCKKSNVSTTSASADTVSQWKYGGKTYTGSTTVYGGTYLESNDYISDTVTNILIIGFSQKPTVNGKFKVVSEGTTLNSKECIVVAASMSQSTTLTEGAASVGVPGDSVTVTIVNGKINAIFSNVVVQDQQLTLYSSISGKLIEQ
jgi:hypothetical protein